MNTDAQTHIDPIRSDQSAPHSELIAVVQRHLKSEWRKPTPAHTLAAAQSAIEWIQSQPRKPLILDSFCGTGMSTAQLAQAYPEALVIGVDKSADRLGRHIASNNGCYQLFRAECEPFWRCLLEAGLRLQQHYILYPNPWPKGSHLKRRVHGHPGFALLPQLGGALELRTNWGIYAQEFAQSCAVAGVQGTLTTFVPSNPLTLFERKYYENGQTLWRYHAPANSELP